MLLVDQEFALKWVQKYVRITFRFSCSVLKLSRSKTLEEIRRKRLFGVRAVEPAVYYT